MAFANRPGINAKPPVTTQQKSKPRGGWDDDDDEGPQLRGAASGPYGNSQTNQPKLTQIESKSPINSGSYKSDDFTGTSPVKKANPAIDYEIIQMDEQFVLAHEYENNIINDLIQPGGARLKQPESALNDFCKACESFQAPVIGSLLFSKLYEAIPFVSKARLLFLIEATVKKVKKYFEYFKHNINVLKEADFSNEGPNAAQLSKLTTDIVKYIEDGGKPKQTLVAPKTTSNPPVSAGSNLLGDDDLLGPSEPKGKQDPFAFIKKSGSDKTPPSQSTANQNFELLDMQPDPPLTKAQSNPQTQAQKFNPFDIGGSQTTEKTAPQPTSNVPLNFKKFQGNQPTQSTATTTNPPTTQNQSTSKFDQLDDLLGDFSGIDFGGSKTESQTPPTQGTSTQGASYQNQSGPSPHGQGYPYPQQYPQNTQGQPRPQNYPQYGAPTGPGGYNPYPGGPGPAPHQWGGNYPPQGQPGYHYPPPNYGYGQPPYGQGGYGAPQGQSGMYASMNQTNMQSNPYQGQHGKK